MRTEDKPYLQIWPNGSGFLYKHHSTLIPVSQALLLVQCVQSIDREVTGLVIWRCCRCNYDSWNNENHLSCRDCNYEPCDDCYIRNKADGQRRYIRLDKFRETLPDDSGLRQVEPLAEVSWEPNLGVRSREQDDNRVGSGVEEQAKRIVQDEELSTSTEEDLRTQPGSKFDGRELQRASTSPEVAPSSSSRHSEGEGDAEKALRLLKGHIDHELYQRAESEAMSKLYRFGQDELLSTRVITHRPAPPNNLACDIHPLFAYHYWTDCRRELWDWMAPALRLASMFLTDPQWVGFWVQLFKGSRTRCVRNGAPDDSAYSTWYLRFDPEDTGSAGEVIQKLQELGEDWTWANWSWHQLPAGTDVDEHANELCDDVVQATGHRICRRLITSLYEHRDGSYLFPVEFDKEYSDKRTLNRGRSGVHIKIESLFLNFIDQAMNGSNITGNQILCFNLHLASVLLHNLGHAVEEYLTSEYYCSRSLTRNQEPAMNYPQIAECGDMYLQLIFQGAIEPVHDISDYSNGLCVIDLSSFRRDVNGIGVHKMWAMPMGHVALYQRQAFWATYPDHDLLPGCLSATRWPKTYKTRYVPPLQPGEVRGRAGTGEYEAETEGEEANWIDSHDDAVIQMNKTVYEAFSQPLKDNSAGPPPINSRTFAKLRSHERERLRSIVKPHWDASMRGMLAIELTITRQSQALSSSDRGRPNKNLWEIQDLLTLIARRCATHFRELHKDSVNLILRARPVKHSDTIKKLGQATMANNNAVLEAVALDLSDVLRRMIKALGKASPFRFVASQRAQGLREADDPFVATTMAKSIERNTTRSHGLTEMFEEIPSSVTNPNSNNKPTLQIESEVGMNTDTEIGLSKGTPQTTSVTRSLASAEEVSTDSTVEPPGTPSPPVVREARPAPETGIKNEIYFGITSALTGLDSGPSSDRSHKGSQVDGTEGFPPYVPDSESSNEDSDVKGQSPFQKDPFMDSEDEGPWWLPGKER